MIKKDAVSCLSLTNVNKNAGNSIFFHDRKRIGTYGELLQKAKNAVRFLYNGSYGVVTDENDLYYMRARYYNPDIKRFLNQDIKVGDISNGQGLNRYAYCEGNPVSMVDPFGLSPQISQDQTSRFSVLHNILDLAGLAFDAADVINAAFYAAEGDWTNAALCAVAVIPIAGSAIAGAAKGTKAVVKAKKAEKILELAEESCKMTRNASDRLDVFSDVMKASSKWGNSPVKLMDGIKAETGSRAIKALETGGDFGRESKRAVQELKAVAGAEGIHLKPSVSRKVDVFKDSFVKTEKKVKSGKTTDFYVMPSGDVVPATGYRYMDSKYAEQTMGTMSAPGSYFGFKKFESASEAQDAFQISPEWSNCKLRGEFDTLQVIDEMYVPKTYGDKGLGLEPFTRCYPEYGKGGCQQFIYKGKIHFKNVDIIDD